MPVESYPVRWAGTFAVVTFPDEVDVTGAEAASETLLSVIGQGASTLIADMSATTFSDSAGVNAIVRAYRRASAMGTELRLVVPVAAVRRVFGITEVDRLIPVFLSLDEATAGLGPEAGPPPEPSSARPGGEATEPPSAPGS